MRLIKLILLFIKFHYSGYYVRGLLTSFAKMAIEVLRLELINVQLLVLCYDYIVRDGKVYVHLSNQVSLIKKKCIKEPLTILHHV